MSNYGLNMVVIWQSQYCCDYNYRGEVATFSKQVAHLHQATGECTPGNFLVLFDSSSWTQLWPGGSVATVSSLHSWLASALLGSPRVEIGSGGSCSFAFCSVSLYGGFYLGFRSLELPPLDLKGVWDSGPLHQPRWILRLARVHRSPPPIGHRGVF